MTDKEIIEGNKLIAEFMQLKTIKRDGMSDSYMFVLHPGFIPREVCPANLEYHTSWDWLMPVVEKIENAPNYDFFFHILGNGAFITTTRVENFRDGSPDIVESKIVHDSKIDATWLAVVEFIKWYNKNK